MNCQHANICGACDWISLDYSQQQEQKQERLRKAFADAQLVLPEQLGFVAYAEGGHRDRMDLAYRYDKESGEAQLGFYDRHGQAVFSVQNCPLMSPKMAALFHDIKSIFQPKVAKLSLRLRVSPHSLRGIWLDMANVDIKYLLEEQSFLRQLAAKVDVIEIGQRRKRLALTPKGLALVTPQAEKWFSTKLSDGRSFDLWMHVASFSQSGLIANHQIAEVLFDLAGDGHGRYLLELCGGVGNLGFAMASHGFQVLSTEWDRSFIALAESNKQEFPWPDRIDFERLDAHKATPALAKHLRKADLVLVDPPRSGLRDSLNVFTEISPQELPTSILYVSCFLDSLVTDLQHLQTLAYRCTAVSLLDQFPHSKHCEYIVKMDRQQGSQKT